MRPDIQRVRELLNYDPSTGLFTRKKTAGGRRAGSIAGTRDSYGYVQIGVDRTLFLAHRLAWLVSTGQWPDFEIDHVNGDRSDNRIANLRPATRSINTQNVHRARVTSELGVLGVVRYRSKYKAQIGAGGRVIYLGLHATPEAAHAAYLDAKRKLHEGCTI